MAQFKFLLLFITTFFILTGCEIEENSDNADVTSSETERSLNEEEMVIETSVISNEGGSELKIELPVGFHAALNELGDFKSVIVTRDVNNAVRKWPLAVDGDSSQLTELVSFDASSLNSIAFHFYNLTTGVLVADCISISPLPNSSFSCVLRTLEYIPEHYSERNAIQYVDITVTNTDQLTLEGAVISSACYGPLGILGQDLGADLAKLSTFIPNYYYGVLEVFKGDKHVYVRGDYSSQGAIYYNVAFPNDEYSEILKTNNGYTAQTLELYGPKQSIQTIIIPEFQSARESANTLNSYNGVSASAQTKVRMSVFNPEGRLSINLNGETIQYIDRETLVKDINKIPNFSVMASLDENGYLILIDDAGDDISIELCSSNTEHELVIWGSPDAGPIVLGSTLSADRIVTIGGTVSWQEEQGYELEMPIISFLALQAGDPNTDLPKR